MPRYADISVQIAQIERSYHYLIPAEMEGRLQVGSLVVVPFGKQIAQGVVLDLLEQAEVENPLPVQELLSEDSLLSPSQIQLARHLAEATWAPLSACVALMIPAGLARRADLLYSLKDSPSVDIESLPPLQKRLLKLLAERGPLRGAQIDYALPKLDWQSSAQKLRQNGLVHAQSVLPPPRVGAKVVRTASLSIPPESVAGLADSQLGKSKATQTRRRRVLDALVLEAFPLDFSWIYAQSGANYADLKYLEEAGFLHFNESEVWRDPLEGLSVPPQDEPELTEDQQAVWQAWLAMEARKDRRPVLLHGVTGSGKTEIYLRAVERVLQEGQQALILVPEISMTPQAVRRFMARFPNRVGLVHSKLSDGERYDTWRRAQEGQLSVIVGSRSALFSPLAKLGLIVLDECDHESYDETERMPFYHSVQTAEALAQICGARLILGSATPRISQYYQAQRGDYLLLSLPRRILPHALPNVPFPQVEVQATKPTVILSNKLPPVNLVDMRAELKAGNDSVLSRPLHAGLARVLEEGQQAILFLNRKGLATYVFCRQCGHVLRCPHDGQNLVDHGDAQGLLCHLCGYRRKLPTKCPQCGSNKIRRMGLGTARLEELVQKAFPQARLLRWDADTAPGKNDHELILAHFSAHRADILIGTQILAKGLDLPLVTLVGIILAESSLNLPDYRAAERSFQVLTQVAGRAGRSQLGGEVIMQTYQPDNYVIQAASAHDAEGFYRQELALRREMNYPPFARLLRLEYRHFSEETCRMSAEAMAERVHAELEQKKLLDAGMIGPLPCYYPKLNGQYRYQIVLRMATPQEFLIDLPLKGWQVELDPPSLL